MHTHISSQLYVTQKSTFSLSRFQKEKKGEDGGRALAALEFHIMNFMALLSVSLAGWNFIGYLLSSSTFLQTVRRQTIEHVELRMARTAGELEEEDVAALPVIADDDEDEPTNELPYNPKGLPLGWDGKV